MTAEELEAYDTDMRCELIDGVLIEMPPANAWHGGVAGTITVLLGSYARPLGLGRVLVECGVILRRNPDTVRAADVSFVKSERIPTGGLPETFWDVVPDIAVEIVSPTNTTSEMQSKIRDWIDSGVSLVWVIHPRDRTVTVVRSLLDREELTEDDNLDGGSILPGFTCRVADLFA
jgi:Uma2 family endonuclease